MEPRMPVQEKVITVTHYPITSYRCMAFVKDIRIDPDNKICTIVTSDYREARRYTDEVTMIMHILTSCTFYTEGFDEDVYEHESSVRPVLSAVAIQLPY